MDKNPTQVVKDILSQRGMTQTDLAKLTGTTLQNVRQLLSKDTLKISTLESFAKALNVPMWQFFASKGEIVGIDDFLAMIRYKGTFHHAQTIGELKSMIEKWEREL